MAHAVVAVVVVVLVGGCGMTGSGARDGGAESGDSARRDFRAERISVRDDGRVLVAGVSERKRGGEGLQGCDGELTVILLDARGKPDTGFGDGGSTRVGPDDEGCVSSLNQLVAAPDGQTLVGAMVFHPSDSEMDDDSFQSGYLFPLTPLGDIDDAFKPRRFSGFGFAVAPDGSIFDGLGTRYLPSGDRDPRDEQSLVTVGVDLAVDVAAQADGKKLFLGLQDRTNHRRLAVQRFNADWQPDQTFGTDGIATADVAPGKRLDPTLELKRVLPAPDGAVIAFGLAFGPERPHAFAIKFDARGQLDHGFGDRGRLEIGPPSPSKEVYDIAAQPDGSLIAIGSSGPDRARNVFVARYTPNGTPTRGFGRAGRATLDLLRTPRRVDSRKLNRGSHLGAITAGPDGATVGVFSLHASVGKSLAFRLRANGTLDPTFGRRGVTLLHRRG